MRLLFLGKRLRLVNLPIRAKFSKKRGPNFLGPLRRLTFGYLSLKLDSGFQNSLDRRDARNLPLIPHLVHHTLNVGEVLFFEMVEAALFREKFLYWDSSLAGLARVPGIDDVAFDDFVEWIKT